MPFGCFQVAKGFQKALVVGGPGVKLQRNATKKHLETTSSTRSHEARCPQQDVAEGRTDETRWEDPAVLLRWDFVSTKWGYVRSEFLVVGHLVRLILICVVRPRNCCCFVI